jgi:PAS domain-containing protein
MLLRYITEIMDMTEDEIRFHRRLLVNVFDQEHRVLFWNKKCEMVFNIGEQEALGKRLEELLPWTQGHDKMAYLHNALLGQPVYVADEKYEQTENYYDQVVLPLKDIKGKVFAALNIVIDLGNPRENANGHSKFSILLNNIQ